jgi:hypothetical protein
MDLFGDLLSNVNINQSINDASEMNNEAAFKTLLGVIDNTSSTAFTTQQIQSLLTVFLYLCPMSMKVNAIQMDPSLNMFSKKNRGLLEPSERRREEKYQDMGMSM